VAQGTATTAWARASQFIVQNTIPTHNAIVMEIVVKLSQGIDAQPRVGERYFSDSYLSAYRYSRKQFQLYASNILLAKAAFYITSNLKH